MTLDNFVKIVCAIGLVVCWTGYHHLNKHDVYARYVDQRVPPLKTKKKGAKR